MDLQSALIQAGVDQGVALRLAETLRDQHAWSDASARIASDPVLYASVRPAADGTLLIESARGGTPVQVRYQPATSTIDISGGAIYGSVVGENTGTIISVYVLVQPPAQAAPALHQLPTPVLNFTARQHESEQLIKILSRAADGSVAAIGCIRGIGGIGKTQLALYVAHKVKHLFPDAQLLVNLRGTQKEPLTPAAALQTVIRIVASEAKIPGDAAELIGLYRSLLHGKHVLILADDARDALQVEPLLPPPGSALLVTGRPRFSINGIDAAAILDLAKLSPEDAEALLLRACPRIGAAAHEIAERCEYLPLALDLAAAYLQTYDDQPIALYLEQLRGQPLAALQIEARSVKQVLGLSIEQLHRQSELLSQRWHRLAVFAAPFNREAAAAIWGPPAPTSEQSDARSDWSPKLLPLPAAETQSTLRTLRQLNLVEYNPASDSYTLHDLLREYARESPFTLRPDERARISSMYLRYFLQAAARLERLYEHDGARRHAIVGEIDAVWQHLALLWRRIQQVDTSDAARFMSQFPLSTRSILNWHIAPSERIAILEAARTAAGRLNDQAREIEHLVNLGTAQAELAQLPKAIQCYQEALQIMQQTGKLTGYADVLTRLGDVYLKLGDIGSATGYYQQALSKVAAPDERRFILSSLGVAYRQLGYIEAALKCHQQARALAGDDPTLVANALNNLGYCHAQLGEYTAALEAYEQALKQATHDGVLAETRHSLAEVSIDLQRYQAALDHAHAGLGLARTRNSPGLQSKLYSALASAALLTDDLITASEALTAAQQFDVPLWHYQIDALRGIVALRRGNSAEAEQFFTSALARSTVLLHQNPRSYEVLYLRGLSLCALALCQGSATLADAMGAYRQGWSISHHRGVVEHARQWLQMLAPSDPHGMLRQVSDLLQSKNTGKRGLNGDTTVPAS